MFAGINPRYNANLFRPLLLNVLITDLNKLIMRKMSSYNQRYKIFILKIGGTLNNHPPKHRYHHHYHYYYYYYYYKNCYPTILLEVTSGSLSPT